MPFSRTLLRRLACVAGTVVAMGGAVAPSQAGELPAPIRAALAQVKLPDDALVGYVAELHPGGPAAPRLAWQADRPVNAASLMKLYTTGVALEQLGPAYVWTTPLLTTGAIEQGVLHGDLVLQGRGDPSLTLERLWLLLRQVQQRGVREVRGDIVLDGSVFAPSPVAPGDFDNEPYRPYNVQADALLPSLKSLTLTFVPEPAQARVRIFADVPLAGVTIDSQVPLSSRDCGDWRAGLAADFADPARLRFLGSYPASCGERTWPLAYADPRSYSARLVEGLWRELGGSITGRVREGPTPPDAIGWFEPSSPPLASVIRDINKFSNNPMAQQLFLSLALPPRGPQPAPPVEPAAAREVMRSVLRQRTGCVEPELVIDNGSGLSREARTSARCLGRWLEALWASPVMPEMLASLPVSGIDGTARRLAGGSVAPALGAGRAHLKTGSLRDANGIAGVVLGSSGRRYALVAIVNHPQASNARPVLDALLQWTADDRPR